MGGGAYLSAGVVFVIGGGAYLSAGVVFVMGDGAYLSAGVVVCGWQVFGPWPRGTSCL